ncbi:hypothetical protein POM88_046060 [Heracleum sosnowskyi]|uniref:Uncharacterized protein n=1 Tax=Heracleum sosnowskyi TaxID=360622 RepID=A0AAD8H861_9APIA|nr:hypothetical protein POM88_046060 [Heracleum sosnowskyi]
MDSDITLHIHHGGEFADEADHNKTTRKTTLEEVFEIKKAATEAKKAQSEATRAQTPLNRSKRATSQNRKPLTQNQQSTQGEPQIKRKRGRPPKAKKVEVLFPPPPLPSQGVGVYKCDRDGHTYCSTVGGSTVKVSSSQPIPPKPTILHPNLKLVYTPGIDVYKCDKNGHIYFSIVCGFTVRVSSS